MIAIQLFVIGAAFSLFAKLVAAAGGLTATQLSAIVGVLLSLVFTFIPGLKTWYASLDATKKPVVMVVALFLTTAVIFGLACLPSSPYQYFTCDIAGFWQAVALFVSALIANQATYLITSPYKPSAKAKG